LEQNTDKAFFKYLSVSYTAFIEGDAELSEQLDNGLADRFEQDDQIIEQIIEQEIERITDLNAAVVEKMNILAQKVEDLPGYTEKRDEYTKDLEQFLDLIRQMDKHIAALNQILKERTEEFNTTNEKIKVRNEKIAELKSNLSKQTLSVADIRKIKSEQQKGVEEAIER